MHTSYLRYNNVINSEHRNQKWSHSAKMNYVHVEYRYYCTIIQTNYAYQGYLLFDVQSVSYLPTPLQELDISVLIESHTKYSICNITNFNLTGQIIRPRGGGSIWKVIHLLQSKGNIICKWYIMVKFTLYLSSNTLQNRRPA